MSLYGYNLVYYVVDLVWHTNRWCGLSELSWDPPGWECMRKGVDSPENHTAQDGALGDQD
jgi:hypothetical protein